MCIVLTVRTYCPTANPHGSIIFQKTVIFTIAVTAPHLAITSLTVLATAYCDMTRLMPCSVLHISLLLSPTITTADVTKWALGLSFCSQMVLNLWPSSQGHVQTKVREQSIKKLNFYLQNLLRYLQLNQTCLLQSTPLHSWHTAPNIFSSSETRPGTCFVGWREGPASNFFLSPLPSEIGDLLVRISTLGTRKSLQGQNLESRAAGGQESSNASSKIHG